MWSPFIGNAVFSDWAVEDGSFLRLQSATLGYTFPEALMERISISKLRIYVTGTNLFCLTNYSGYDPEVDTRRATPLTPGVDYSAYPKSRGIVRYSFVEDPLAIRICEVAGFIPAVVAVAVHVPERLSTDLHQAWFPLRQREARNR